MRPKLFLMCIAMFLMGCVATAPRISTTASGKPEQTIKAELEKIQNEIINDMVNYKYTVESQTKNSLVMTRPADLSDDLSAYFTAGNAYSRNERITSYTFIENQNGVRVIATPGLRARMVGGQVNTADLLNVSRIYNEYQKQLDDIKRKLEGN